MALFQKAETTSAFLKMGLMGFAGAGKTYTATRTAIGLVQHMRDHGIIQSNRPVYFLDTETGSDFVKDDFDAADIELRTAKTRAFKDLVPAVIEAEKEGSVLIIDSISHFWTEFLQSYQRTKKRRLLMNDWPFLKAEWAKFTERYINSDLHIIMCGRAGHEYDHVEDEGGKKQLEKTGIKMKAEGEMGYEPSLLVLMERETDMSNNKVQRIAYVLKDRFRSLDGKAIVNPGFEAFASHITRLNLGGKQMGVDSSRTSDDMIPADESKKDWKSIKRKIALDEIQTLLVRYYPSTTVADKKAKADLIHEAFQAATWTEISEVMPLVEIQAGYDWLHRKLEDAPSKYASEVEPPKIETDALDDILGEGKEISKQLAAEAA